MEEIINTECLNLLSSRIEENTRWIEELDRHFAFIIDRINAVNIPDLVKRLLPFENRVDQHLQPDMVDAGNASLNEHSVVEQSNAHKGLAMAATIGELTESSLNLYNAFAKLPPSLEQVSVLTELFNGSIKAINGIEAVASAVGLTEILEASNVLAAGLEGIASIAAAVTPVGWMVGGAALGGIAISGLNDQVDKSRKERTATFSDEGVKNGNEYLLHGAKNETMAEHYIRIANKPKEKTAMQIVAEEKALKDKLLVQGGSLVFDWEKAESRDPVYIHALVDALNTNEQLKSKPIQQVVFGLKEDMEAFRKQFDKFEHFPLKVAPRVDKSFLLLEEGSGEGGTRRRNIPYTISQKEYEKELKATTGKVSSPLKPVYDVIVKSAVASYLNNGLPYVQKEYRDQIKAYPQFKKQINQLWTEFLNVKQVIDVDTHNRIDGKTGLSARMQNRPAVDKRGERAVININLNRPMIGNFTINTRDVKEGINNFKHEVEEVLLEILNSANVI